MICMFVAFLLYYNSEISLKYLLGIIIHFQLVRNHTVFAFPGNQRKHSSLFKATVFILIEELLSIMFQQFDMVTFYVYVIYVNLIQVKLTNHRLTLAICRLFSYVLP